MDDALGQHTAQQEVFGYRHEFDLGSFQVAQMLGVDALVFFDDDLAGAIGDIEVSHFAFPALGYELEHAAFVVDLEVIEIGEESKDGLGRHADGFQQNGYRQDRKSTRLNSSH